jgi:hypothetical protein
MQHHELAQIMNRLRRRLVLIDGTAGTVWGAAAAVAVVVCGAWIDLVFELPAGLRLVVLLGAVTVAAAIVLRAARHARNAGAPVQIAERLDRVAATRGQILSAVDLDRGDRQGLATHRPELSAALAKIAVERAVKLAGAVAAGAAIPARAVSQSVAALAIAAATIFLVTLVLPRVAATEWRRFVDPFGDNPPFSTIEFEVQPGDAKVVYGSGLEVRVGISGGQADSVEMVLEAAPSAETQAGVDRASEVIPMFPEPDAQWRASIANITGRMVYYLRARSARSRRFSIDVITVPKIETVNFRVTPPAYTRQSAYEGALPPAGLTGLPGTEILVSIRSNRPLSGGKLTCIVNRQRSELPMSRHDPAIEDTVAGTITIAGNGRLEAEIIDVDGQASADKYSAPVTQLTDERPIVRLVEPRAVSFATPTAIIPVVIAAEDDYGLAQVQLYRSLNDSRSLPVDIQVGDPPPRLVHQVVPLPLVDYGLEAGDEIKLFARVTDNDPVTDNTAEGAKGKGTESAVVLIRIISQQEFDRYRQNRDAMETLTAKYQEARRRLESLADEAEKVRKELAEQEGKELTPDLRQKMQELAEKFQREAEALRRLAAEKLPFAIDQELTKRLEEQAERLEQLQKKMQELADDDEALRQEIEKEMADLAQALKEQREQLEQEVMQPLEQMRAMLPLLRDEQRFVALYRRQRDLADRLAGLKDKDHNDDPALKARMRDLEDEQRKLRNSLEALLSDIEEHAAGLPEEEELRELRESALEFVEAVRSSGAAEAMTEAENGLSEFDGARGHAGALQAADILESLIAKAGNMGQGGAANGLRRFGPSMGDAMGQSLQQMMQSGQPGGGESGFGMPQNSNVGLYGDDPNFQESNAGGGGPRDSDRRSGSVRNARDPHEGGLGDRPTDAPGRRRASGGTDATIPLRYRRQVGRYFQKIVDELGEPDKK